MSVTKIVLASSNLGKIKEIQAILPQVCLIPQSEWQITDVDETGITFVENALLKARHAAYHSQLPAIADDSGLAVDALHGAPGVFSARYAGIGASDAENNLKLLQALAKVPDELRTARFICVMVFLRNADDPMPLIAQGVWAGHILREPLGVLGFGYDPLFWLDNLQCSAAQLPSALKNTLSHRAQALAQLSQQFDQYA